MSAKFSHTAVGFLDSLRRLNIAALAKRFPYPSLFMHIFLTGGAGYIGSICVEYFINIGHQVTVFDNLTEGHRRAVDPRADFVLGDLQNRCDIEDALENARPDAVMHFAANALVGESMTNPSKYFRNNVAAGVNLLDATIASGCRKFVFSSTCATFGVPERVPIDEAMPQNPINPYGESKLMFEKVLRWYDEIHGLRYVSLRYFNAAGASERYGEDHRIETHLIPNVLKVALGQKPHVEVYGTDYPTPDGTCVRDYIHILDLAAAHMLALESLARGKSEQYNLGTGGGTSVREVIDACRKVTGRQIAVVEQQRRPGDPPRLIAGSDRIKSELGWRPNFQDIETIVESAWKWHLANPNGYGA
jgi:UDP-glucose 4-epimerase